MKKPSDTNWWPHACIRQRVAMFAGFLMFIAFSCCKKEFTSGQTEAPIQYHPFGENRQIDLVVNADDNAIYTVIDARKLIKVSGEKLVEQWSVQFENVIAEVVNGKNGELITIENANFFGYSHLYYTRINAAGSTVYTSKGVQKLVPQYPNFHEQLIAACSDGNNGLYVLAFLTDRASTPVERRILVHINQNNVIDQTVEIFGFFVYMQSDSQGNLYLIRTTSGLGAPMTFEAFKLDLPYYKTNNLVKKIWTYSFTSNQADWKWTNYFPFKFISYQSDLFILKQRLTGINDLSTGIDVIKLNAQSGSEIVNFFIPWDAPINFYNDYTSFYPIFNSTGCVIAFNYGKKAKVVKTDISGTIVWQEYLSGNANRCNVSGMGYIGKNKVVFGAATLNKSPSYIPFYYLFNTPNE